MICVDSRQFALLTNFRHKCSKWVFTQANKNINELNMVYFPRKQITVRVLKVKQDPQGSRPVQK